MKISLICEPAPIAGRLNEDACFVYSDEETVVAAAIDGATQRIDVPALYAPYERKPGAPPVTGARFAAHLTKHVMVDMMHRDPADMIQAANTTLRQRLEQVAPVTAADFARLAPAFAPMLNDDPRLIRLMLPVCVATVVKLDLASRTARFAHAGDTALFVFHTDGRISHPTADQMGQHDDTVIAAALAIKAELNVLHLADIVTHERVTGINRHNGLFHNYVDVNGVPDPALGVGVINGLPEIAAYIRTGEIDLSTVAGVLVCSDGFPLPASWHETREQAEQRAYEMRDLLFAQGIGAYFTHLRAVQASDPHLDRYPRFKMHDDTTGVFVILDPA